MCAKNKKENQEIKIVDLFAGIGGIRLGFEKAAKRAKIPVKCVFTSEIDKYACVNYRKNFQNDDHDPENDITEILSPKKEIRNFDVLLAGFPCQAFSIAGRRGGFEDTRGTLFFDVARILKDKRPKAFLLENVKGLVNHRQGRTLETILNVLRNDLKYGFVDYKILNSKCFGVPQNRERVYIVGFTKDVKFQFPKGRGSKRDLKDVLEKELVSVKYYLSQTYLDSLRSHRERHESKGNGFGYEIVSSKKCANAIVVGGMGRERNLLVDKRLRDFTPVTKIKGSVNREGIRRMTPLEWEALQGFPSNFTAYVSDAQRYKQLGNAVSVPVIKAIARKMIITLKDEYGWK